MPHQTFWDKSSGRYINFSSAGELWNRAPDETYNDSIIQITPEPPAYPSGYWIFASYEDGVKKLRNNSVTSLNLPEGSTTDWVFSNGPTAVFGSNTAGIVITGDNPSNSGVTAVFSNDSGQTWADLDWAVGAELESPSFGTYALNHFISSKGNSQYYSYSSDGLQWTYAPMQIDGTWYYVGSFIEFNGALYAGLRGGSNSFIVAKATSLSPPNFEIVDSGVSGLPTNFMNNIVNFDGKLVFVEQESHRYRTSLDGITWSSVVSFTSETTQINKVAVGNGWIIGVNAIEGSATIFAAQSDLSFQKYTIPGLYEGVSNCLKDIAFGEGKFIVVGDDGVVVSFDQPGNWTTEDYGFGNTTGVFGINFFED